MQPNNNAFQATTVKSTEEKKKEEEKKDVRFPFDISVKKMFYSQEKVISRVLDGGEDQKKKERKTIVDGGDEVSKNAFVIRL